MAGEVRWLRGHAAYREIQKLPEGNDPDWFGIRLKLLNYEQR